MALGGKTECQAGKKVSAEFQGNSDLAYIPVAISIFHNLPQ